MKGLAFLAALLLLAQAAPSDPLDTQVYIYDGGSIYHQKDCVSLFGHVHVHPVALRQLGKGWDGCATCKPVRRPAGAADGPIVAEYAPKFLPPLAPLPPGPGFTSNAGALPTAAQAASAIRAKCATEWPDDFQMRAYCATQQQEGLTRLQGRSMAYGDQVTIRTKCGKDWPDDFNMRNYCEEEQLKALASIR